MCALCVVTARRFRYHHVVHICVLWLPPTSEWAFATRCQIKIKDRPTIVRKYVHDCIYAKTIKFASERVLQRTIIILITFIKKKKMFGCLLQCFFFFF